MNKKHKVPGADQLVTEEQYQDALSIINHAIDELNDGWTPDWSRWYQFKYYIYFNPLIYRWGVDWDGQYQKFYILKYLKEQYNADKIIKSYKGELETIRKYKFNK